MWNRSQSLKLESSRLHAVTIKIGFSALAWFLAVTWLKLAAGVAIDPALALFTGIFVMVLTLVLVTASPAAAD